MSMILIDEKTERYIDAKYIIDIFKTKYKDYEDNDEYQICFKLLGVIYPEGENGDYLHFSSEPERDSMFHKILNMK